MHASESLHNVLDRPFSRAKARDLRRSSVQRKTCLRIQKQVATGSPIETKTDFWAKPRSGYVAGHTVAHLQASFLPILVRHRLGTGNRAGATEFLPS